MSELDEVRGRAGVRVLAELPGDEGQPRLRAAVNRSAALDIDEAYHRGFLRQGPIAQAYRAARIAQITPGAMGTLTLSYRDGKLYIVNGYQRWRRFRDDPAFPLGEMQADIFVGMTQQDEAQIYVALNTILR